MLLKVENITPKEELESFQFPDLIEGKIIKRLAHETAQGLAPFIEVTKSEFEGTIKHEAQIFVLSKTEMQNISLLLRILEEHKTFMPLAVKIALNELIETLKAE